MAAGAEAQKQASNAMVIQNEKQIKVEERKQLLAAYSSLKSLQRRITMIEHCLQDKMKNLPENIKPFGKENTSVDIFLIRQFKDMSPLIDEFHTKGSILVENQEQERIFDELVKLLLKLQFYGEFKSRKNSGAIKHGIDEGLDELLPRDPLKIYWTLSKVKFSSAPFQDMMRRRLKQYL